MRHTIIVARLEAEPLMRDGVVFDVHAPVSCATDELSHRRADGRNPAGSAASSSRDDVTHLSRQPASSTGSSPVSYWPGLSWARGGG